MKNLATAIGASLACATLTFLVPLSSSAVDGDGPPKAGPRDGEGGPKPEAQRQDPAAKPKVDNSKEAKIFRAYDKDGDESITDEEIVGMMEGKQNSRGRREIRKAVDRADKNEDGVLNFDEFAWWLEFGRADEKARNR